MTPEWPLKIRGEHVRGLVKSDLPQVHLDTGQGNRIDIIKNHSFCKTRGRGPAPGGDKTG